MPRIINRLLVLILYTRALYRCTQIQEVRRLERILVVLSIKEFFCKLNELCERLFLLKGVSCLIWFNEYDGNLAMWMYNSN